ncbi:transcriptional regulator domain-containing protein [Acidomonas methanolica]|uniref:transcriptional regulator domain-containing protein n=1 Tax=Acidomonas methanolica TaxID=437 RepID=UPI00211A7295|nr:DUF6499 domain-containing protein [Acidomonas methanolica]
MSRANWRSAGAYEGLRSLDAPAFALQFVSRNRDFLRDRATLQRVTRGDGLVAEDAEAFARRWGMRFRECPHGPRSADRPLDCCGIAGCDRDGTPAGRPG